MDKLGPLLKLGTWWGIFGGLIFTVFSRLLHHARQESAFIVNITGCLAGALAVMLAAQVMQIGSIPEPLKYLAFLYGAFPAMSSYALINHCRAPDDTF